MAKGIYIAFGFQQLGVPLAWIISPFLVNTDSWSVLYTFELGLALCCLAMVVSLKLPRSLRIYVLRSRISLHLLYWLQVLPACVLCSRKVHFMVVQQ